MLEGKSVMGLLMDLKDGGYFIKKENYKRITAKTVDTFNLFIPEDEEVITNINNLVTSEDKLNVSIKTITEGKVKVNPIQAKNVGIDKEIECVKYRNQAIIRNGRLNMDKIEVLADISLLCKLLEKGYKEYMKVLQTMTYNGKEYNRVEIDLRELPIVENKGKQYTTKNILELAIRRDNEIARGKVLKYYIDALDSLKEEKEINRITYNKEQLELLKEHGVDSKGVYVGVDVKKEIDESKFNIVKTVELQVKGQSSIPSVNSVIKKITGGKKLNNIEETMANLLDDYKDKKEEELQEEIKISKEELSNIKTEIMLARLDKIINDMEEFEDTDIDKKGNRIYSDGKNTLVIKIGAEKVYV